MKPERRLVAAFALSLPLWCTGALPSEALGAEPPGRCTAVRVPADSQDVTCVLDPATLGRPLRFVAQFAGSHDDTRLRRDATLDGEPLACVDGSNTSLFAEDGIVHLDCRFRPVARPGPGSASVLKVALTVNHAQFISSSVAVE
jgi:hypothetical protein